MSIIRPCNPSFSDLFVLAVFFCLFACFLFCLILALSVLPIIPEQTSTLFLECVTSVSVRFRIKERGTRARSSDGGDWSGLDSYTGKNEEGGWGWWPPARSRLTSGADMKLCCFLLFVFLFRFVFFSFSACYCRFFKFCCVFFSCRYHIRMQTNSSLFLT